ncbi:P9 [Chiqui virus]|uniref:P9 n=1 Tax=Chiqui virus TaxID=2250219 RepID=UPI000DC7EACB|nr:P9 [Chiqui virus]AWX66229.1 P9 [Chiqui virus]
MQFSFRPVRQPTSTIVITEHPYLDKIHDLIRGKKIDGGNPNLELLIISKTRKFKNVDDIYMVPTDKGIVLYTPDEEDFAYRKPQQQQLANEPFKTQEQRQNGILFNMRIHEVLSIEESKYIVNLIERVISDLEQTISELKIRSTVVQQYCQRGIDKATIDAIIKAATFLVCYKLVNREVPSKFSLWLRCQKGLSFMSLIESMPSDAKYYDQAVKHGLFEKCALIEGQRSFNIVKKAPRLLIAVMDEIQMGGGMYIRKVMQSNSLTVVDSLSMSKLDGDEINSEQIPTVVSRAKSSLQINESKTEMSGGNPGCDTVDRNVVKDAFADVFN